jgi:protein-tyrosine phosphatase
MAEVVLRAELARAGLADRVVVDSAGTGNWHVGQRMNPRARAQLERSGYDGDAHRARQFEALWLAERDLVLAMDASNLADLQRMAPYYPNVPQVSAPHRLRLFGEVAGLGDVDVPDPYGGNPAEFARVLAMLQKGMATLVARLPESL